MAKFYIKDYVKANDFSGVIAVSWQVALDYKFLSIVDETAVDRDNIEVWYSPLKRIDGPGFYTEKDKLYVRCKIHTENNGEIFDSDWYMAKLKSSKDKPTNLTDPNGNVISKIMYDDSEQGYSVIF